MATFLAFKEDTTIGIAPTPNSGSITFCENFCFDQTIKK